MNEITYSTNSSIQEVVGKGVQNTTSSSIVKDTCTMYKKQEEYLTHLALIEHLTRVLEDNKVQRRKHTNQITSQNRRDDQFQKRIDTACEEAEKCIGFSQLLNQYVSMNNNELEKPRLFGLSLSDVEELERQNKKCRDNRNDMLEENDDDLEGISKTLIPLIEKSLKLQCMDIAGTLNAIDPQCNLDDDFSRFPDIFQVKLQQVQVNKLSLSETLKQKCRSYVQLFKVLNTLQEKTMDIVKTYKLESIPQLNQTKLEWMEESSKSIQLKLLVLLHQLRLETYTIDKVKALKQIRKNIEEQFQTELTRNEQLKGQLENYTNSGEEYHKVVQRYQQLLLQIEEKKQWIHSLDI